MAQRVFLEQVRARGDKLVRNAPPPPKDLSVPPQVRSQVSEAHQQHFLLCDCCEPLNLKVNCNRMDVLR